MFTLLPHTHTHTHTHTTNVHQWCVVSTLGKLQDKRRGTISLQKNEVELRPTADEQEEEEEEEEE